MNYRNPAEVAEVASRVLRRAMPGMEPPRAVRSTGLEPRFTAAEGDLGRAVRQETRRLLEQVDGTVGVVVAMDRRAEAAGWLADLGERAVALGSLEAKGLEYDATVVVSPAEIADESPAGLRVLYVALTRATQQLTVVSTPGTHPTPRACPRCWPRRPADWAGWPAARGVVAGTTAGRGIAFGDPLLAWVRHRLDPSPRAQPSSPRATTCREASMAGRCSSVKNRSAPPRSRRGRPVVRSGPCLGVDFRAHLKSRMVEEFFRNL